MSPTEDAGSAAAAAAPIAPVVVRSLEPIDLAEFLARYARAIVEAKGTRPSNPTASPPEAA